ncbi:MAG: shikimate dehydrogenase [Chitinophagaceae bacterium]|nr:shikimate dehydrogenase [Chitinophagaceae bacterium]
MRLFGLIGYPLTHSFSKRYFSEKFENEGIKDCRYELFPIPSIGELNSILDKHPDLAGINVTIPYKEQVLSFLNEKDDVVQKIKACNCIRINEGKLKGYNTDVTGFERSLKEKLQPNHHKALVLGTGGASKAVEFVLQRLGITFRNVSRKPSVHSYSYEQLTPAVIADHTLIVNTTPLGTFPAVNEAPPLPYEALTSRHYLFDLVYNPARTLFLQKGEERGAAIKNGYDMLVIQAEESWRIWNL